MVISFYILEIHFFLSYQSYLFILPKNYQSYRQILGLRLKYEQWYNNIDHLFVFQKSVVNCSIEKSLLYGLKIFFIKQKNLSCLIWTNKNTLVWEERCSLGIEVIKVQDPSSVEAQQKKTYKDRSFSLFL